MSHPNNPPIRKLLKLDEQQIDNAGRLTTGITEAMVKSLSILTKDLEGWCDTDAREVQAQLLQIAYDISKYSMENTYQ